jgi:hypothetical protein
MTFLVLFRGWLVPPFCSQPEWNNFFSKRLFLLSQEHHSYNSVVNRVLTDSNDHMVMSIKKNTPANKKKRKSKRNWRVRTHCSRRSGSASTGAATASGRSKLHCFWKAASSTFAVGIPVDTSWTTPALRKAVKGGGQNPHIGHNPHN